MNYSYARQLDPRSPGMRLPRVRFTVQGLMVGVAVVAFLLAVRPYNRRLVDELRSPVTVTGWSDGSLLLADGRAVRLPDIRSLPISSTALSEATWRGVELGRGGRVHGLVRVHHWCGNDPVREHIARVDLSYLLAFLGEGEVACQIDPEFRLRMPEKPGGRFTASGWEVGEYLQFRGWCRRADDQGGSFAPQVGPGSVPPPAPSSPRKNAMPLP